MAGILDRTDSVDALWKAEARILKRHQLRQVAIPLAAALLLAERISKGDLELEETNRTLLEELRHEE
jgi:hypothetical protein